jgi:hypothetical protein
MRERRGAYRVWLGDAREIGYFQDLGVDGRIILKWIFSWGVWVGLIWLRMRSSGGLF